MPSTGRIRGPAPTAIPRSSTPKVRCLRRLSRNGRPRRAYGKRATERLGEHGVANAQWTVDARNAIAASEANYITPGWGSITLRGGQEAWSRVAGVRAAQEAVKRGREMLYPPNPLVSPGP